MFVSISQLFLGVFWDRNVGLVQTGASGRSIIHFWQEGPVGGVASQMTTHIWDQCLCWESQRGILDLSPASGDWKIREKRFTHHGFVSIFLEHPKVVPVLVGKSNFVTKNYP